MAKKSDEIAPAAVQPEPVDVIEQPAVAASPQRRNGLAIAGIVVGSVLVAGALFGGGVAVGANLPGIAHSQFERPGFPGDDDGIPGGGPGPIQPGDGDGDTDSN